MTFAKSMITAIALMAAMGIVGISSDAQAAKRGKRGDGMTNQSDGDRSARRQRRTGTTGTRTGRRNTADRGSGPRTGSNRRTVRRAPAHLPGAVIAINQTQALQKKKIRKGIRSGALSWFEARRLRKGQRRVNRIERRALQDGILTRAEANRIRALQQRQDRKIKKLKSNGSAGYGYRTRATKAKRPGTLSRYYRKYGTWR